MTKKTNKIEISKELNDMIYHGDLLNPIGIFQAAMCSKGTITKEVFTEIIRRNYNYDSIEDLLIFYQNVIDSVWKEAEVFFTKINYLIKWTETEITLKIPFFDN